MTPYARKALADQYIEHKAELDSTAEKQGGGGGLSIAVSITKVSFFHVMLCHVMSCYVMLYYVILCHVMLYNTNSYEESYKFYYRCAFEHY